MRYGENENLIKSLIAAGYPVIAEKDITNALHRQNRLAGSLFIYDLVMMTARAVSLFRMPGLNPVRIFRASMKLTRRDGVLPNYLFLVVYPAEREMEVLSLLGPWQMQTAMEHSLRDRRAGNTNR
jgi:hypothetical protein